MKKEVDELKKMKEMIEVESHEAYTIQQKQHERSILETQQQVRKLNTQFLFNSLSLSLSLLSQYADLAEKLKSLQEDYTALQKAHESLESVHQQLVIEKQTLKSELDVSKEDNALFDQKLKELQKELSHNKAAMVE